MKHLRLFLSFMLFFATATAFAQSTLVVELRDGSNATFQLAEKPRVTFVGEQLNIVSSSASMEINRSDVKNWHFESATTSVDDITVEAKATLDGNTLIISGITENTAITLYTVSGAVVKRSTANDGICTIPLDGITAGVYFVTYNSTTFKFFKK
ncbi:MAG: T9SS type A sorting domain-containing protein [Bacteroidaceae bacterium]|nr:T9SS type A sorting domain-containing protein [Bacteroidaceae bacterium]